MKPTELELKLFWVILIAIGLFLLIGIPCYVGHAETVTIEGNSVTIIGDLTEEQREAGRLNWVARQAQMRADNSAEIERRHEVAIEVAKHQVALDLERAGADNIYLSSNSSSYSSSDNALENSVSQNVDVTQRNNN